MFENIPTNLTLILCMSLVVFSSILFFLFNRKPINVITKHKLISMAERHLYYGPPEPCTLYQTYEKNKACLAARSLVTGKDIIFPPHYRDFNVKEWFLAYGYTLAQETVDSKIIITNW